MIKFIVKSIIFVALLVMTSLFLWSKFQSAIQVSTEPVPESRVSLDNVRLESGAKLTFASVFSNATGRVGETTVIHTNIFGAERYDTVPLGKNIPGAKFVDFVNVPMVTEIGIDAKLQARRIFNPGTYGIWNEDHTLFTIYTTQKKLSVLSIRADNATENSESWFTGSISKELYNSALMEKVGEPSLSLFENSPGYWNYCYANATKIFAKQFLALGEKKDFEVRVLIDGVDYSVVPQAGEFLVLGTVDISKTVIR